MRNVFPIDHARIQREKRRDRHIREASRPMHMGNLRDAVALLDEKSAATRADEFKEFEIERLHELVKHTVAQLALWDSRDAMVAFVDQLVKPYRVCGND